MRRLPVYFLVDVSESMVGEPIEEVQNGMRTIIQELRMDPYALEMVFVSIIAFAGKAQSISPLTELYKFYPPVFPIGGGTALGNGLNFLMDDMDRSLQKTTMEVKGDWKPIIFLFTDGTPTDDYAAAFKRWNDKYRKHCNLVAISIGDNVNTQMLGQITDNVLCLRNTDPESFKAFFKWVTASIKTTSVSVTDTADDEVKLASTAGINLEKVDTSKPCQVDENFAVILGKCQTTNNLYLIKFAKRIRPMEIGGIEGFSGVKDYKLVGAYSINQEMYKALSDESLAQQHINTSELRGTPTCPCCGNQIGMVICECGNVFCAGESSNDHCPWCGMHGELQVVKGGGGMNVNRTIG